MSNCDAASQPKPGRVPRPVSNKAMFCVQSERCSVPVTTPQAKPAAAFIVSMCERMKASLIASYSSAFSLPAARFCLAAESTSMGTISAAMPERRARQCPFGFGHIKREKERKIGCARFCTRDARLLSSYSSTSFASGLRPMLAASTQLQQRSSGSRSSSHLSAARCRVSVRRDSRGLPCTASAVSGAGTDAVLSCKPLFPWRLSCCRFATLMRYALVIRALLCAAF